jgi:hypothetical protein
MYGVRFTDASHGALFTGYNRELGIAAIHESDPIAYDSKRVAEAKKFCACARPSPILLLVIPGSCSNEQRLCQYIARMLCDAPVPYAIKLPDAVLSAVENYKYDLKHRIADEREKRKIYHEFLATFVGEELLKALIQKLRNPRRHRAYNRAPVSVASAYDVATTYSTASAHDVDSAYGECVDSGECASASGDASASGARVSKSFVATKYVKKVVSPVTPALARAKPDCTGTTCRQYRCPATGTLPPDQSVPHGVNVYV